MIERPQHPYTQALVDAIPVPAAGGGGQRELLSGELPDPTDVPSGCRFHPRCPKRFEPCDRVDPPLMRGGGARPARGLPAARPRARQAERRARPEPKSMAERWRDIAGPVGRLEPGARNAITDVPGVRVGHAQAESGERTGVTVVAPPSLPAPRGHGGRQRDGRADRQARDRRARHDRDPRLPLRHARGRHRPPRRGDRLGPRPGRRRASRWSASATTATWPTRARSPPPTSTARSRRSGEEVAEGTRRRRHRDDLLRLPGRHRHRLAASSASTTSACCCSATSATASYLDLLGTDARAAARERARHAAPASRSAPPTRRSRRSSCAAGAAAAARARARRLLRRRGLGRDRARVLDRERGARSPTSALDPYFAAAYEAAHEAVYNCLVAARPAERLDGTMQEAFPIEPSVRSRDAPAQRSQPIDSSDEVVDLAPRPDPDRHLEPARQRDRRPPSCSPPT